ncbi:hypothetical protein niasHS_001567 [Heterodera schachtii]|uniref:Uncharacterized protein n=1 Tax=Heterodera schachtii TaxID=97005 RepID=A0ABD2KDT7_HETSC
MKLTVDFDRGQQALLRRGRPNIVCAKACFCESIAERILDGESPVNVHKWAFHGQPPKFLKSFLRSFSHSNIRCSSAAVHSSPLGPFSQSATHLWPITAGDRRVDNAVGGVQQQQQQQQYGHHSFDSLERSVAEVADNGCAHAVLFAAILGTDRTGYLTLLQNWGIPLLAVRDSRGQCPMHWAVQRKSMECISELFTLQQGAAREWALARDNRGITPIHLAAAQESAHVLNVLLGELGLADLLSVATDQDGMNPLHHAAAAGSAACCEQLLSEQWELPVDVRDAHGRTPLHHAAWSKFAANVLRLLANKKNIAASARDERGWTPLHTAVVANNEAVLRVLLHELGVEPQIFDHESRTPLHYAALHDRAQLARLLIESGASNDTRDRFNVTPAHYAAQCASYETLRTIMKAVKQTAGKGTEEGGRRRKWNSLPAQQHNAVVVFGLSDGKSEQNDGTDESTAEPLVHPLDNEGRTPFMWAVIAQNQTVVQQMLLDKIMGCAGKLVSSRDIFKRTPLHLAALVGNLELCKMLVNEGHLNANDGDMHGATPEHMAAGQGNSEVVLWFGYIRGGHVKPPVDLIDRTPFHYACLGGQANTIEAMLRSLHVDPNDADSFGCSALHCSVISGSLHCVRAVVENKSVPLELFMEDKEGRTGLAIAREHQFGQIAQYLDTKMTAITD